MLRARALSLALLTLFSCVRSREESDERDDEHTQHERRLILNIIVLTVTVLVAISLTFETLKEYLLEHTSENMLPIINSLFGELTLLGFIGLTLYLVFQLSWLTQLSETLYNDPNKLNELGEVVHMVLFMVMVLFLTQAVAMARMGEATQRKWSEWESRRCGRLSRRTCRLAQQFLDSSYAELLLQPYHPRRVRALLYAAVRLQFLHRHRFEEGEFDFANYLAIALGRTFSEIVEVPVKTWLGLEACLLTFFFVDSVLSKYLRFALWIILGYCILGMAFVVHAKLRIVLRRHVSAWVAKAIAANKDRTDFGAEMHMIPSQAALTEPAVAIQSASRLKMPNYATSPTAAIRAMPGSAVAPPLPAQTETAECKSDVEFVGEVAGDPAKADPTASDEVEFEVELGRSGHPASPPKRNRRSSFTYEKHIDPVDVPTLSPRHKPVEPLWLDTESCEFEQDSDRSRVPSPYEAKWRNCVFCCAVTMAQRCGDFGLAVARTMAPAWDHINSAVASLRGAHVDPLRSEYRSLIAGSETHGYAKMFWFGTTHKAQFTLDVIRTIPLFMSIYIAVFALVYAPRLYPNDNSLDVVGHLQNILLVTISIIPPVALQIKLPFVVDDFTVSAHVGAFRRMQYVEQVLVRQKTVAAFQALRVVACLQHPELLAKIVSAEKHRVETGCEVEDCTAEHHGRDDHDREDEMLEKLEIAEAMERRSRRSWASLFQLFDRDHTSYIDRSEMRELLTRFSISDDADVHIDEVIALLDEDGNDQINFEEFYAFGKMLENHFSKTGNPRQLVNDMFTMIDKDHGGSITVEELHTTMREIGLDLSVNVVYVRCFVA